MTGIGRDFQLRLDDPTVKDGACLIVPERIGIDVWRYHLKAMGVPDSQVLAIDPRDRDEFVDELAALKSFQGYKKPRMTRKGEPDKRQSVASRVKGPRPEYRYYICHWDAVRLVPELRIGIEWAHLILDEVHLIKNRDAVRTKEIKRVKSVYKTGLSGTPADDKPQDLWSVLNWLYPRQFTSFWRFFESHVLYVAANHAKKYKDWIKEGGTFATFEPKTPPVGYRIPVGVKNIPELHKSIRGFYIRRTLLDVAPNMPRKTHVEPAIIVPMTPRQRKEYNAMRDEAIVLIGQSDSDIDVGGEGYQLHALAFIAVLTRLQQMSLATLSPEWPISNAEYVSSEEEADFGDGDWDMPKIVLTKPSPKLDAVMNIIQTHEEESFVVFTNYRGMADLIEEECLAKKISVVKIHGGIASNKSDPTRTELVEEFQSGRARVFVGTIAAAGKTITLTKAAHVIFTDLHWNASKNEQAEDRLWRRTQLRPVMVHRIESENSIDQVRFEKISEKAEWIRQLLDPNSGNK